MINLINEDIFNSDAEVLVIPISVYGYTSEPFNIGLNRLGLSSIFVSEDAELGEIYVTKINNHKHLKYIIKACSVSQENSSSYTKIRSLGQKLALKAAEYGISKIACPILGTGYGGLQHDISASILFTTFKENAPDRVELLLYSKSEVVDPSAIKMVVPSSRLAFDADLNTVLKDIEIQNIINESEVYYELAYKKFAEYNSFKELSNKEYKKIIADINNSKLSFGSFLLSYQQDTAISQFLNICGELITYLDSHAYFKKLWNAYSDYRVISKTQLQQMRWLLGLVQYKYHNQPEKINSKIVRNMILHLMYNSDYVPIISETHKKQILTNILLISEQLNTHRSSSEIISFFKRRNIECRNYKNNTALYTAILYNPIIKELWSKDTNKKKRISSQDFQLRQASKLIFDSLQTKNKRLDLGRLGITDLMDIPELFDCVHLEELILSNEWAEYNTRSKIWQKQQSNNGGKFNTINELPKEIGNLTNLTKLICGGDWIYGDDKQKWEITSIAYLSKLTKLEFINISNNKVKSLTGIEKLEKLKIVHMNNNAIKNIEPIKSLINIKELYLSNNNIEELSVLSSNNSITTLDLHANRISSLQDIEEQIKRMGINNSKWEVGTINIAKNPLVHPPMEFIELGGESVLQYFADIKESGVYQNTDIKIILVGNSEVGKTTLLKYLSKGKYFEGHPATHWFYEESIDSPFKIDKIKKKCKLRVFDFGGHDYYHDTHHLFFSNNTIYILLWDTSSFKYGSRELSQKNNNGLEIKVRSQDYPVDYWLDSIKFNAKDIVVKNFDESIMQKVTYNSYAIVVQNKVDEFSNIKFLNTEKLYNEYPFIFDFTNASIKNNRNLEHLINLLKGALSEIDIIGAKIPAFYNTIKEDIEGNYDGEPIMTLDEFLNYCNSILNPQITQDQADNLALYLNQIGIILLFLQENMVCIGKKNVIKQIHTILEGLYEKEGEFDANYVNSKLESTNNDSIISIMENFNMIFRHPVIKNTYIAPLYLPQIPSDVISLFISEDIIQYRRLEYSGYIHKNVILKFFQKYSDRIFVDSGSAIGKNMYYYWKDALIIKELNKNNIAMIKFCEGDENNKAYIDIYAINKCDETFFKEIVKDLNQLNNGYDVEELVSLDGKEFISIDVIKNNASNGILIFTESRLNENKTNNPPVYKLKDYMKFIDTEIKKKKVVISYSKKDLTHVHTLRRYLKPLVDDGLIEDPWYCTKLRAGNEWDLDIETKFKEADIVFFMVSDYFYSTEYIVEHEIKNTIDKYEKDHASVKIIPIILEYYNWGRSGTYNLQRFTALPYQAKPISDFNNAKMAWYAISESVKMVIERDVDSTDHDTIKRELEEIYERQVSGRLDNNSN